MIHLWLIGKRVVNFLLVLIEDFRQLSRLRRHELLLVEIVVFHGVGGAGGSWAQISGGICVALERLLASEN